ncbi:MAG: exosortase-dependent surface protein XDP2 [Nostoc sp.]|uniref:exosortase-dependent surface protein XDP2 n=1 Tax=Nostoc sp. TaxID=1180 RepID=UPI002FFD3FFE
MKIYRISTFLFICFGAGLAFSPSVKAATFDTNFTQSLTGADASKGDIWLNYITQNGTKFNNLSFVNKVDILSNTPIANVQAGSTSTPGDKNNNTGAASTDKGDKASAPIAVSGLKDPTGAEIAAFVGNKNLNNIIDTEDTGSFKMNLFFDSSIQKDNTGLDNLFFWERGMNSDLGIQAIDSNGKLIGKFLQLNRQDQKNAGYSIDTTEIDGAQQVGSWGVQLKQLGVTSLSGIQITTNADYNGPDFKVIARSGTPYYQAPPPAPKKVPEPNTAVALGLFAIGALRVVKKKSLVTD